MEHVPEWGLALSRAFSPPPQGCPLHSRRASSPPRDPCQPPSPTEHLVSCVIRDLFLWARKLPRNVREAGLTVAPLAGGGVQVQMGGRSRPGQQKWVVIPLRTWRPRCHPAWKGTSCLWSWACGWGCRLLVKAVRLLSGEMLVKRKPKHFPKCSHRNVYREKGSLRLLSKKRTTVQIQTDIILL